MSAPLPLSTMSWGSGPRRALLLHGIGSNAAGWWRVGDDLAAAGWSVVAADLRGHGASPSSSRYSLGDHAADVLALGSGWDAVLGHSMGAAVAVLCHAAAPGFAGRLVLQDPAIAMPEPVEEMIGWLVDVYERPLTPEQLAEDNPRWHPHDCAMKAEALRRTGADVIAATVEQSWPWNVFDELTSVSVPTVIIGSDPESRGIFPVTLGRWLDEVSPHIEYTMLPGSSHSAHRDADSYAGYIGRVSAAMSGAPNLRP
jgi:pimeloyl-ACP methyl ester carboxylesterase